MQTYNIYIKYPSISILLFQNIEILRYKDIEISKYYKILKY